MPSSRRKGGKSKGRANREKPDDGSKGGGTYSKRKIFKTLGLTRLPKQLRGGGTPQFLLRGRRQRVGKTTKGRGGEETPHGGTPNVAAGIPLAYRLRTAKKRTCDGGAEEGNCVLTGAMKD